MKSSEQKNRFVILRAEGKSYDAIAHELNISKSTCSSWERELKQEIAEKKSEQLQTLYDSYYMTKEARIKSLGGTLEKIQKAVEQVDLSQMSPKELLDYKLKYTAALKEEYVALSSVAMPEKLTPEYLLESLTDLLERARAGEVTTEQANRESVIISNMLRAYEQVELKSKMDMLEAAIGRG